MAKSGNNENKIEKLVRVGFYELEKTIGKQLRAFAVDHRVLSN